MKSRGCHGLQDIERKMRRVQIKRLWQSEFIIFVVFFFFVS